jgi:hypothetical protein
MPNEYKPYESTWSLDQWKAYCPNLEYRVVEQKDFPSFLPTGLTVKFNCGMVVASGSATNQTFMFQGYRVDKMMLDEHQYIATYNLESKQCLGAGFVEHADYTGRSTVIPAEMQQSMSLSGIAVDYQFPTKPPGPSGSIQDLIDSGLIKGFENSVKVQNQQK